VKITFPHMGYLNIPLRSFFNNLGQEVIEPPAINQHTINLGTRYAPEFACLPLKINIGNFIQAAELGANTIVMAGGIGPCRFGYYAQVQREILADLGINMDMIVLEPPQGGWKLLLRGLRRLTGKVSLLAIFEAGAIAWAKLKALDQLAQRVYSIRAQEISRGSTNRIWKQILTHIDGANDLKAVQKAADCGYALLQGIKTQPHKEMLKVGLVGEIYTVLEPAVNLGLEEVLGSMGVEVVRSIYLSEWVITNLVLHTFYLRDDREHYQLAAPYLDHFVGGHGIESISNTVKYARAGMDGVIHVAPLTCMPEIVAKTILPGVSLGENIPVLTLMLDEHSAEAGILTRLEAFCELLWQRKRMPKVRRQQNKTEMELSRGKLSVAGISGH